VADEESAPRRAHITRTVQARLQQQSFRERVLAAYGNQCALCRLRRRELLEASHIIPDSDPRGVPEIRNGWRRARSTTPRSTATSSAFGRTR
jgi:putative restriction endonuclease